EVRSPPGETTVRPGAPRPRGNSPTPSPRSPPLAPPRSSPRPAVFFSLGPAGVLSLGPVAFLLPGPRRVLLPGDRQASGDPVRGELRCGEPADLAPFTVDLAHLQRAVVEPVEAACRDQQAGLHRADEPVVVLHCALQRAAELADVPGHRAEPLVQGAA